MKKIRYFFLLLVVLLIGLDTRAQVLKNTFAAGAWHSLSIHADGTLWATGDNRYGQLGDGTTTTHSQWVQVSPGTSWVQVATSEYWTMALRADGTLWAWGSNTHGQLATTTNISTFTATSTPTQVPGSYVQIAAGFYHGLALRADGSLWSWGDNSKGELGRTTSTGDPSAQPVPTRVGTATYTQLAATGQFSLAIQTGGTLWAWGNNQYGQLGNAVNVGDPFASNPTPKQVGTALYTQVEAGYAFSLGLRADGTLWAWGNNESGQLGTTLNSGTPTPTTAPRQVGTALYTRITAGYYHSLGLRADGTLWTWGLNQYGQLGTSANLTTANSVNPVPMQVGAATNWAQLVAGAYHTLALRADGTLWTCGYNYYGQLGTTANVGSNTPTAVLTVTGSALPTRSTAAGSNFGLAIRGDGTLWAWGGNAFGQLGDGTTTQRSKPVQIGADTDWLQVTAGEFHSLALKANGQLYAWGNNTQGQLGVGTATLYAPASVAGSSSFTQVIAGTSHSLALTAAGTAYAWGANSSGQLGLNTTGATVATPTAIGSYTFVQLAAGTQHSLALTATGAVYAWGNGTYGQLGPGGTASLVPTLVGGGLPPLAQLSAGSYHNLGLTTTGTVYSWGSNYFGQLGTTTNNGSNTPLPTPTLLAGLPPLTQLAAGNVHSLGLTATGAVYGWGSNSAGQLGLGTTALTSPIPIQEATLGTGWTTLAAGHAGMAGNAGSLALVRTASAQTFASAGNNSDGQLGDGTTTNASRFDRMSPLASLQPLPVLAKTTKITGLLLAPNPARAQVAVMGLPAGTTLVIYDALGRVVRTSNKLTFEVSGLPVGLYLVHALLPGQASQMARLLVE